MTRLEYLSIGSNPVWITRAELFDSDALQSLVMCKSGVINLSC
jgi:hypothetical protein